MLKVRFNLQQYRKRNGLTQAELAEKLRINQGMVSYYERNWRTVKNSTIQQIANTLGVDPEALFMDDNGTSAKDLGYKILLYPDDHVLDD